MYFRKKFLLDSWHIDSYMACFFRESIFLTYSSIQSPKEIDDLQQRTREGIETFRRNGKHISQLIKYQEKNNFYKYKAELKNNILK